MLIKTTNIPKVSPQSKLLSIEYFFRKKIEFILVSITFVSLFILFFLVGGGPIFSDEIWYMQVGLNNIKDPLVLNRYFHIFLQKLFMEAAPTPLIGAKVFWSFLVSLSGLLIYVNARIFSDNSNYLNGITAVAIFYSVDLFAIYSGVTIIDITAMTVVLVIVTLYTFTIHFNHSKPLLLVAMGATFFLGFKTKETTVFTGLLILGLGFQKNGSFNIGIFKTNLVRFGLGVLLGLASFVVMNAIILRDPFFGLRPDTFNVFFNYYSTTTVYFPSSENWFKDYLLQTLLVPFLFYLLSGIRVKDTLFVPHRLLWLVPLAFLAFMTFTMIRSNWGAIPRYILPVLGIICLLASQLFVFRLPDHWRNKLLIAFVLCLELILLYAFRVYIHHLMYDQNWENAYLLETVILIPITLMVLLGVIFLFRVGSIYQTIFTTMLLVVLLIYPLSQNIKSIVFERPNVQRVEERFYPFSSFASIIKFDDDMKFFISTNVPWELHMLSDNIDELLSMFNIYFEKNSRRNNFIYSTQIESFSGGIYSEKFDYILLTSREWNALSRSQVQLLLVEKGYQLHNDESDKLVLLSLGQN
ncbi:MAG: hypothetical protein EHM41_02675 [Chloroflexi bacterium]|nr:MAG: hypothetical protein EHM41_02675 [Chloroflexota bacterium]